jgi:RNA polymerase sigma-70 factor, ECF subfamily
MFRQSKYHVTKEEMDREHLIVEEAKKDPEKFSAIYNKYYQQIFRFLYQRVSDKETAFDFTSQVFLKALQNLHKYTYRGVPFSSWLYRIAHNEINQVFRKKIIARTVNIETEHLNSIIEEIEEEDDIMRFQQVLIDVICDLPEGDLELIEMRFFEKRPFKEIAEILDITENNAKVKVYRILEKLKIKITSGKRK